jgi:hypothetical protein
LRDALVDAFRKAGRDGRGRALPPSPVDERVKLRTQRSVEEQMGTVLTRQRLAVRGVLLGGSAKAAGGDVVTEEELRALIRAVEAEPWSTEAQDALRAALEDLAQHASAEAVKHVRDAVGAGNEEAVATLTQAGRDAVAWATERSGNLITQVSETTRNLVNELTANAIESGLTNAELAARLDGAFLFGADRAAMIARTETQFAANHGALVGYAASGVVEQKAWVGEDPCEDCEENIAEGAIGMDDEFPSGDDAPPAHPNCKCSIVPVVDLEAGKLARSATTA